MANIVLGMSLNGQELNLHEANGIQANSVRHDDQSPSPSPCAIVDEVHIASDRLDSNSLDHSGSRKAVKGILAASGKGHDASNTLDHGGIVGPKLASKTVEDVGGIAQGEDGLANKNGEPVASDIETRADMSDDEGEEDVLINTISKRHLKQMDIDTPQKAADRFKRASERHAQHVDYTHLLEERVSGLERRLQIVEGKDPKPKPPITALKWSGGPLDMILDIKRMGFTEYRAEYRLPKSMTKHSVPYKHVPCHEFPGQTPYHIIDVIYESKEQAEGLDKAPSTKPPAAASISPSSELASPRREPTVDDWNSVQPNRIRINSHLLLSVLEKISGLHFRRIDINEKDFLPSQVILRPFKFFVAFEKDIRGEIMRLEHLLAPRDNVSMTGPRVGVQDRSRSLIEHPITSGAIAECQGLKEALPSLYGSASPRKGTSSKTNLRTGDEQESLESMRCLEELRILGSLLANELKPTFDLRQHIAERTVRKLSFQDLWHLYSPGTEIVCNGSSQVFRILEVSGGRPFLCNRGQANMDPFEPQTPNERDIPKFQILAYCYASDGKILGNNQHIFTIKLYEGTKAITALPCYPIAYANNSKGNDPRESFIARGKRYIELMRSNNVRHKRYNGLTQTQPMGDESRQEIREEIESEVIMDENTAFQRAGVVHKLGITDELTSDPRETQEYLDPECRRQGCCQNSLIFNDYIIDSRRNRALRENKRVLHKSIEADDEVFDEDYLICPCGVMGYVLRSRKWVYLNVDLIEDIRERGNGFDSLVLPEGHKETLLALVQQHRDKDSGAERRQMELIRGKGRGLIILLHGEPGVGKTLTAESVAEYTHRPLLQVTCGDIGQDAETVEKRLEDQFQLAHKWGCVLLLDEADVFLQARTQADLKRNAIVSVFLRVLEYYSGILFLTTNRVGAFDQAFRSRIHMSLFFPKLDEDSTIKIWKMNTARARETWGDKLSIDEDDEKAILKFASEHYRKLVKSDSTWSGRQIRNAFQTAIALAEWDAQQDQLKYRIKSPFRPRLGKGHFERVAKPSLHFDAYLKDTMMGTPADVARDRRERHDEFRVPKD